MNRIAASKEELTSLHKYITCTMGAIWAFQKLDFTVHCTKVFRVNSAFSSMPLMTCHALAEACMEGNPILSLLFSFRASLHAHRRRCNRQRSSNFSGKVPKRLFPTSIREQGNGSSSQKAVRSHREGHHLVDNFSFPLRLRRLGGHAKLLLSKICPFSPKSSRTKAVLRDCRSCEVEKLGHFLD